MSETFDADWLALREGVDHRARSADLAERLHDWAVALARSPGATAAHASRRSALRIVDLGSGTGSNLRYLAPRLPRAQSWLLVDHDEELLGRVVAPASDLESSTPLLEVSTRVIDLVDIGASEVDAADVVTASALLDLVSSAWIESLAETCANSRCAALFALTVDGTVAWGGPPVPGDDLVRDAVNAHQRREKGLGPALGPDAGAAVTEEFRRHGYQTFTAHSPWQLGPDEAVLARALVTGWADAAVEQRPADEPSIRAWARSREQSIGERDFALTVGHLDVLALPSPGSALDPEQ